MSALTADGEGSLGKLYHTLNTNLLSQQEPQMKPLQESIIVSLITKGSNIQEVTKFIKIQKEYKADITAAQHIVWNEDHGWCEMLQYRPGMLGACILYAQKEYLTQFGPSFQRSAALALSWTVRRVLGFQMGISSYLYENIFGPTDHEYLLGMSLGYMFFEAHKDKDKYDTAT